MHKTMNVLNSTRALSKNILNSYSSSPVRRKVNMPHTNNTETSSTSSDAKNRNEFFSAKAPATKTTMAAKKKTVVKRRTVMSSLS